MSFSFMDRGRRVVALSLSLLPLLACDPEPAAAPVDFQVQFLGESTIPADVVSMQYAVIGEDGNDTCATMDTTGARCSGLMSPPSDGGAANNEFRDLDGDGRPELLVGSLPFNTAFSIELRAYTGAAGVGLGYIGRVGPIILRPGERRHIAIAMYPVGAATALDGGEMRSRVLSTATPLQDGRVLISGGFDVTGADCPAGADAGSKCFDLEATAEAWLFDPATARFWPVQGGMLAARGGHTATALPGGRVLIAGGAAHAGLQLLVTGPSDAQVLEPHFTFDAADASAKSFEIFEPDRGREAEDLDADGDPGRGLFTGAASDPASPGALNQPRFMHAAASTRRGSQRVLLAGGVDDDGRKSWEIFDLQKPGGYGVYFGPTNSLPSPRTLPSAVTGPDGVWIIGGAEASDNAGLADVWTTTADDVNGRVRSAREFTGARYPNPGTGSETPRPQYALMRPALGPLDDGASVVVLGWLGPRCAAGSSSPTFDATATDRCPPTGGPSRNHTTSLGGMTSGITVATTGAPAMAFGSSAVLDDGSVFFAGGVSGSLWLPISSSAILFDATTNATTGGAARLMEAPTVSSARVFAASAAIPGRGVLTVGGINTTSWDSPTPAPPAEVWLRSTGR